MPLPCYPKAPPLPSKGREPILAVFEVVGGYALPLGGLAKP